MPESELPVTARRRITTEHLTADGRVWTYTVDEAEGSGGTAYLAAPAVEAARLDAAHDEWEALLAVLEPLIGQERRRELDAACMTIETDALIRLEAQILALLSYGENTLFIAQSDGARPGRLPATEARRWHRRAARRQPLADATRVSLWRVAAGNFLFLSLGLGLGAAAVGRRRGCTR